MVDYCIIPVMKYLLYCYNGFVKKFPLIQKEIIIGRSQENNLSINDALISRCYSAGQVTGNTYVGGLIGTNAGTIENSFWDKETSGLTTSAGGTGKTTAEMKREGIFTNWNFVEIWNIGEEQTYPFLRVYPTGDLNHDGRVDFVDFAIVGNNWLIGVE